MYVYIVWKLLMLSIQVFMYTDTIVKSIHVYECMYVRRHVSDLGGALCGHVRPAVDQRPVGRTRHRRVNLLAIRSVWGPLVDPG
jgi:hypothetical protein